MKQQARPNGRVLFVIALTVEFSFSNKNLNQGFNHILILVRHFFNGLKLVQEFFVCKRAFGKVIGSSVGQEIGRDPERIGQFR
jgi:hypothetical protein